MALTYEDRFTLQQSSRLQRQVRIALQDQAVDELAETVPNPLSEPEQFRRATVRRDFVFQVLRDLESWVKVFSELIAANVADADVEDGAMPDAKTKELVATGYALLSRESYRWRFAQLPTT